VQESSLIRVPTLPHSRITATRKPRLLYHPLIISLANTGEPLYLVNRRGNRPSHEGATERFNSAIDLCLNAGFTKVLLRGDTDFTQSQALDD